MRPLGLRRLGLGRLGLRQGRHDHRLRRGGGRRWQDRRRGRLRLSQFLHERHIDAFQRLRARLGQTATALTEPQEDEQVGQDDDRHQGHERPATRLARLASALAEPHAVTSGRAPDRPSRVRAQSAVASAHRDSGGAGTAPWPSPSTARPPRGVSVILDIRVPERLCAVSTPERLSAAPDRPVKAARIPARAGAMAQAAARTDNDKPGCRGAHGGHGGRLSISQAPAAARKQLKDATTVRRQRSPSQRPMPCAT